MTSAAFAAGPSATARLLLVCRVEAPRVWGLRLSTPPHIHAAPQHVDRRGPTTGGQSGDPGPLGLQLCSILYMYFRENPRVLKNPRWAPRGSPAMLPSATQLARIGSRLAQGGNLCLSPRSSVAEAEQPLDVLSRGDEQSFGVHLLQCPRSESSRPMPVLGLPEERLDPYRTFPYG